MLGWLFSLEDMYYLKSCRTTYGEEVTRDSMEATACRLMLRLIRI